MTYLDQLLERISAAAVRAGMSETTFGRLAVNDGKLVARIRGGKTITLATASKIEAALLKIEQADHHSSPSGSSGAGADAPREEVACP